LPAAILPAEPTSTVLLALTVSRPGEAAGVPLVIARD
jgi:hypothetical protein